MEQARQRGENATPDLSVVLPVYNEAESIADTLQELATVLRDTDYRWEALAINDGSTDDTLVILKSLVATMPELQILSLIPNAGQSAAFDTGFREAAGRVIVTMDADGQNDPADIPRLLSELGSHDCCFGYRAEREDGFGKRIGSVIGNAVRNGILGESIRDTGCSLKAFPAAFVQRLTLWKGLHRFLGSLLAMQGASIVQIPVNHRARQKGVSKYTNLGRLKETVWDLMTVRWMKRRCPRFRVERQ
ncbi:MAG: glycosyltransferase family 2 protein [Verrucomicrobia bacterium]|jgi:dolichol-phosphate mannosyltransferase|nr:glycosyltransferase family 2 protein [Verrucomicrobiota bacterium]